MLDLVTLTVDDLNRRSKGSAIELSKRYSIKKAIGSKNPDLILAQLQKTGDLGRYYKYWEARSGQDPDEIRSTLQGGDRPVIEILIDIHILKSINEPTKIIWEDPNIVAKSTMDYRPKAATAEYLTQSALSRALNVSRNAIYKQCKAGNFDAALNDEGHINIRHPSVVEYAERLGVKIANIQGPSELKERKKPDKTVPVGNEQHQNISPIISSAITLDQIEHLTVREVSERFGGIVGFKNYVDSQSKMMEWKDRESKFLERRSQLVSIGFYKTIFSIIDQAFKDVLENPERIVDQLLAIAKSGKTGARIDMIDLQKETLSRILKNVKNEAIKALDAEKN